MATNWTALNSATKNYRTLAAVKDEVTEAVTLNFCGLHVTLSEILKAANGSPVYSVIVFADTIVLDASLEATGLILVARCIDTSALTENTLVVDFGDTDGLVQVMGAEYTGGPLKLAAKDGGPTVSPPVSTTTLETTTYISSAGSGTLEPQKSQQANAVAGLVSQSWSLNSMMASFGAATYLMEDTASPEPELARKMLAWVVAGTASLAGASGGFPANYNQLYSQAASLLTTLTVAPGATFVPVLSAQVYKDDLPKLVAVLSDYEQYASQLETAKDIDKAVKTVAAGMEKTATIETAPLKQRLANITTNAEQLAKDISRLRADFVLQEMAASTAFETMLTYVELSHIEDQLKAELSLAMSLMKTGIAVSKVEEDPGAIGDIIENGIESIENGIDVIKGFMGHPGEDNLAGEAIKLLDNEVASLGAFLNAKSLFYNMEHGKEGSKLPINPASITIDPVTAWNAYWYKAEAQIASIRRGAGSAVGYVDEYEAALKILIGTGKAIGGKLVAYIAQIVAATEVTAQIEAAKKVASTWKETVKEAKSEAQKLSALQALVASRTNVVKRSVFVSWTYYADAYFYLNFERPAPALTMGMSAAEMGQALTNVDHWVENAISNTGSGGHVHLPSTDTDLELSFDISGTSTGDKSLTSGPREAGIAFLDKTDDGKWVINWGFDVGSEQLKLQLPNDGKCAIWITKAEFFVDGVTPNTQDNVIVTIATSGTYENGFGASNAFTFATKGLIGNYIYEVTPGASGKIKSPWVIDPSVYMMPTPYTQWTMTFDPNGGDPTTAKKLTLKLTVSYTTTPPGSQGR